MARLVGICRDSGGGENDDASFQKHQLPVFVEDMRTMIVEFDDPCAAASNGIICSSSGKLSLKQFREKVSSLKPEELRSALTVKCEHFNNTLLQLVPCVGCRRSAEKLYGDLSSMGHPAVFPLTITSNFALTVHHSYLTDVKLLYRLLITDGQKVRQAVENLTKCRKNNKRCTLHSLDIHMCRTKISWEELWDLMSEDCRDECCVVESDSLLDMLETYLEKHRFCTECRAKVMKAYNLLVGEGDKSQEKGYNPLVYQGLRYCPSEQHLHLKPSVQYLNALIDRAEPELMGGRERHAKTLDVAQGEVLTCLGLYMYDRLHRLVMALKTLQATFQLLYCTGIIALHTNFQETLERKHGLSDSLERLCAELQDSAANPASQKHQAPSKGGNGLNGHNGGQGNGKRAKKKPAKSASASSVSVPKTVLSKVLLSSEDECPNCVRRKSTAVTDSVVCARQHTPRSSPSPSRRASPLGQRSYSLPRNSSAVTTLSSSPSSDSCAFKTTIVSEDVCQQSQDQTIECVKCTISKKPERKRQTIGDDDECSSGSSCCHDPGYCSQELSPGGGSPASGSCRLISKSPRGILSKLANFPCEERLLEAPSHLECLDDVHNEYDDDEAEEESDTKLTSDHSDSFAGHGGFCSCSLLNMLEEENKENGSTAEDSLISAEDVKWFRENETLVSDKRRALRERLIRQFHDMQERMQARKTTTP